MKKSFLSSKRAVGMTGESHGEGPFDTTQSTVPLVIFAGHRQDSLPYKEGTGFALLGMVTITITI